ncbi:MAG: hypothetical protein D6693_01920 [Planctomycetota bacterium]|nr:MAG: hypothetical protein D6693_01920 [Planctomycetota bacterium]
MKTLTIAVVAAAALSQAPVRAQTQTDPEPPAQDETLRSVLDELARLRERVGALEEQHDADLQRIRQLEERLARPSAGAAAPSAGSAPPASTTAPIQTEPIRPRTEELPPQARLSLGDSSLGWGNQLNPAIGVLFDMGASLSSSGDDDRNRFNLREVELDIRAAVAPFADAIFITTFEEEIENPGSTDIQIARNVDIEEGYINFHSLPAGLSLKAGKFRNAFGENNRLHTHALPQVDRPLAVQAFLGGEGLATTGASVSWLVPNPLDQFIELTAEVVNADGGEESPLLGGPNASNPAVVAHLKWFTDVGETGSLQLGGSYLFGASSGAQGDNSSLFGADATFHWQDPDNPDARSLLIQGELFYGMNDTESPALGMLRNESFGAYLFGEYQFAKNLYAGTRFDYTEFPSVEDRAPGDHDLAVSPYLSLYLAENVRLRFQYQQRFARINGETTPEANFLIGLTFSIGAHPPHAFGAFR